MSISLPAWQLDPLTKRSSQKNKNPNYSSTKDTKTEWLKQEEREATEVKRLAAAGKESGEVILRFLC
jgi:hypothetical protein